MLNMGGYVLAGLIPVLTDFVVDHAGLSVGAASFLIVLSIIAIFGGMMVAQQLKKD